MLSEESCEEFIKKESSSNKQCNQEKGFQYRKSVARKYLREFSDVTTLHGVRFIGEKKLNYIERLFWVIIIVLCTAYSTNEMIKIWHRWKTTPVITSFSNNPTYVGAIPFPAVTICPANRIKKSVIDLEKINFTRIEFLLNGELEYESDEEKFQTEIIGMLCHNKGQDWAKFSNATINITKQHLKYIIETVSPQIDEIFESCIFSSTHNYNCKDIFRPFITYNRVCYTFNNLVDDNMYSSNLDMRLYDFLNLTTTNMTWDPISFTYPNERNQSNDYPMRYENNWGPESGLRVVLKYPKAELQDLCSIKQPETFSVFIQSVETIPYIFGSRAQVTPGMETSLILQPEMITTAPELRGKRYSPEIRGCIFPEDRKLRLYKHYSQDNCLHDCAVNITENYCKCKDLNLPYSKNNSLPFCDVNYIECDREHHTAINEKYHGKVQQKLDAGKIAVQCDCFPSCTSVNYKYLIARENFLYWEEENISSIKYSALDVHFDSLFFYSKHRSELYGVTDFIASCGGLLGLFTGFSLISGIEILYFATLRLFCKLRRNRNNNNEKEIDE